MAEFSSCLEAYKWAGLRQFLTACAANTGVRIETEESEGLIFSTIYFTVTGEPADIEQFKVRMYQDQALTAYLGERGR